jgi:gliding motility-associated-like protein
VFSNLIVNARHIAGGEIYYTVASSTATTVTYDITVRLFRDCQSLGPKLEAERATVAIYENGTRLNTLSLSLNGSVQTLLMDVGAIPCLTGNPVVCYEVAHYIGSITLPINAVGYTLTVSNCCRVDNIINLAANGTGSTFTTYIPGTNVLPSGLNNSSIFNLKDTSLVCANKKFVLDFGATDIDGDSLAFSFCTAYTNQPGGTPTIINLSPINYRAGYNGNNPLGSGISINLDNGQITGIAPAQGEYVVSVCVNEIRNGNVISFHNKDFILKVQDCDIAAAELPKLQVNCKNYNVYFENLNNSSSIIGYAWDFGDKKITTDTSTSPTKTYTYADTGTYVAYLKIVGIGGCKGEDSTIVKVYPGFNVDFSFIGSCFANPFTFKDLSTATYGTINKWYWKFGDITNTSTDTSTSQNPTYKYPSIMTANVNFIASSSKGCVDTIKSRRINITDKPFINLPFKDTLICTIDTLMLQASSPGNNLQWTPNYNIVNTTSGNPSVYPKDTTTYYITASNGSCINTDSIIVYTLDFITVQAMADTSICSKDSITLMLDSKALNFLWIPNVGLNSNSIKTPNASPTVTTKYYVTANLGKCQDKDSVSITPFPYPIAIAGKDSVICFGKRVQFNANYIGDVFNWQPVNSLINGNSLNPIAGPSKSTSYILTAKYNTGCLKQVSDTITVFVEKIQPVFAGRDTFVTLQQPLIFQSSVTDTALTYLWYPSTGLNNATLLKPTAIYTNSSLPDSLTYTLTATTKNGCSTKDDIKVRLFKLEPDILVPDAFTPNKDGKNDILKPIPIGITELNYFSIFNRWGQPLFNTKEFGKGWDGTLNGLPAESGTYIFQTQGIDFRGKTVYKKGVFVLIR